MIKYYSNIKFFLKRCNRKDRLYNVSQIYPYILYLRTRQHNNYQPSQTPNQKSKQIRKKTKSGNRNSYRKYISRAFSRKTNFPPVDPFPLDGDRKTANFPDRSPESTEGRRSCRAETVGAATQRRASESKHVDRPATTG